jgi:hypothetical protein
VSLVMCGMFSSHRIEEKVPLGNERKRKCRAETAIAGLTFGIHPIIRA